MMIAASPPMFALSPQSAMLIAIPIAVGVLIGVVFLIRTARRRKAGRTARWEKAIDEFGLQYEAKGEIELSRMLGPLPGIPKSGRIRHVIRAPFPDPRDANAPSLELLGLQHEYTVHTGHAPVTISHTIYATDAPPAWPELTIAPRSRFGRWIGRLGWKRGLDLANEELCRAFRVTGDESFAITLLGPEMQTFLLEHRSVWWCIRPPRVIMVYTGPMRPDRIGRSLDRLRRFWLLVPPEMHAWAPPASDEEFAPPEWSPYPPGPS